MFSSASFSPSSFSPTSFSIAGIVVEPVVDTIIGNILQNIGTLTQAGAATIIGLPPLAMAYSDRIVPTLKPFEVRITTGDNVNIQHVLTKRGKKFYIPTSATIVSRIIAIDRLSAYTIEIPQLSTQLYADWGSSTINVQISQALTESIKDNDIPWVRGKCSAILETQVFNGTKESFFSQITLEIGTIT